MLPPPVDPVVAGSSPVRLASGNVRKALESQGFSQGADAEQDSAIPPAPGDSAALPLHKSLHDLGGDELVELVALWHELTLTQRAQALAVVRRQASAAAADRPMEDPGSCTAPATPDERSMARQGVASELGRGGGGSSDARTAPEAQGGGSGGDADGGAP